MIELVDSQEDLCTVDVGGHVSKADYERVLPKLEAAIREHGPLRMLIRLGDLGGVEPGAVVEELRFDIEHRDDFRACALVGDARWHGAAARLGELFLRCPMRSFARDQEAEARAWLDEMRLEPQPEGP